MDKHALEDAENKLAERITLEAFHCMLATHSRDKRCVREMTPKVDVHPVKHPRSGVDDSGHPGPITLPRFGISNPVPLLMATALGDAIGAP